MQKFILKELKATREVVSKIEADPTFLNEIQKIITICVQALNAGNKMFFAGNGGSAADSQHLAAELVSRLRYNRPGLAGIALTTDTSGLTAIGNDYAFEEVFSRQLEAIGQQGDIFIGISTSGNSANILRAFEVAGQKGITRIGFTGQQGGKMQECCDYILNVPSNCTPKIQEAHITLGHIICAMIEEEIYGAAYNPERSQV